MDGKLPILQTCCVCVPDLKTATVIIAILAIVTSPIISWAIVRHPYSVKVNCDLRYDDTSRDAVDINLSHAVSFSFGGFGASCLSKTKNENETEGNPDPNPKEGGNLRVDTPPPPPPTPPNEPPTQNNKSKSIFANIVQYIGWIILLADVIFVATAINLLIKIFKGPHKKATRLFLISGLVSIILNFLYGLLYVGVCIFVGSNFPALHFLFIFIDLTVWLYFLLVVFSYYRKTRRVNVSK